MNPIAKDPSELDPRELLQLMANFFEKEGIHYRVVGSMASMAYGEYRLTNDVDIVAELTIDKVKALCESFPLPDFYVSEDAAKDAVMKRFQFNIIHSPSGLKVDVMIPPRTDFAHSEKVRARRLDSPDEYSAWFGSPEDIILNKLLFYKQGGSEKHLRDIAGMMKVQQEKLDRTYISDWAVQLGVVREWKLVCDKVGVPPSGGLGEQGPKPPKGGTPT